MSLSVVKPAVAKAANTLQDGPQALSPLSAADTYFPVIY